MIKSFENFIFYSNDFEDFLYKEIIAHLIKKFHINEKKAKYLIKKVFSDKEIKKEIYNLDLVNRAKDNQELIPNAGRKIVEQFFIYFQQSLNERMIVVDNKFISDLDKILDECREKVKVINIPSKVFSAFKKELKNFDQIDIIFTRSKKNKEYSDMTSPSIFVDYYSITSNGVVVYYGDGFIDLLAEIVKDDEEQNNFKFELTTSVSHEMIHIEQYYRAQDKKSDFNITKTKDYNTEIGYFKNKQELMSFTWEIYYELSKKHKLSDEDIINLIKNISKLSEDELQKYSKQLYKYYNIFHGTKTQHRFIIYITDIIRIKKEQEKSEV